MIACGIVVLSAGNLVIVALLAAQQNRRLECRGGLSETSPSMRRGSYRGSRSRSRQIDGRVNLPCHRPRRAVASASAVV